MNNTNMYNKPTQGDINYTVQLFEKFKEIADNDALKHFAEEVITNPAFPEMTELQKITLQEFLKSRGLPLNFIISYLITKDVSLKKTLRLYKIIREMLLRPEYDLELPESAERIPAPPLALIPNNLTPVQRLNLETAAGVSNQSRQMSSTIINQRNNNSQRTSNNLQPPLMIQGIAQSNSQMTPLVLNPPSLTSSNSSSTNTNTNSSVQNNIIYNTGLPSTATTRMYGSEFYGPPGGSTNMNRRNFESEEDYIARIMPEISEGGRRRKQRKTRNARRKQRKSRKSKRKIQRK